MPGCGTHGTPPAYNIHRRCTDSLSRSFCRAMTTPSFAGFAGATLVALVLLGSTGCARHVTRVAPEQAIDLSGDWNDVDSRLVAQEMIQQSFQAAGGANWAARYARAHAGELPTVIVGTIRNRSMEHIPVGTFVRDLEQAYVNSGVVQVVASPLEREEIRDERWDQQQHAAAETRTLLSQETGADFMLQGDIQSIEDREAGRAWSFIRSTLRWWTF